MTPITRRIMIGQSAAALAVASSAIIPTTLHAAEPGARAALFVFDARFARSAMLADSRLAAGAILLDPRETDLGVAWRETIPSLLKQGRTIEGLTLWSDRMICEIFARDAGATFTSLEVSAGDKAATKLQHWQLK